MEQMQIETFNSSRRKPRKSCKRKGQPCMRTRGLVLRRGILAEAAAHPKGPQDPRESSVLAPTGAGCSLRTQEPVAFSVKLETAFNASLHALSAINIHGMLLGLSTFRLVPTRRRTCWQWVPVAQGSPGLVRFQIADLLENSSCSALGPSGPC